jgi:hypothetical protein
MSTARDFVSDVLQSKSVALPVLPDSPAPDAIPDVAPVVVPEDVTPLTESVEGSKISSVFGTGIPKWVWWALVGIIFIVVAYKLAKMIIAKCQPIVNVNPTPITINPPPINPPAINFNTPAIPVTCTGINAVAKTEKKVTAPTMGLHQAENVGIRADATDAKDSKVRSAAGNMLVATSPGNTLQTPFQGSILAGGNPGANLGYGLFEKM